MSGRYPCCRPASCRRYPVIYQKRAGVGILFIRFVPLAADFLPMTLIEWRKICVAGDVSMDQCQIQPVSMFERLTVDFRATDDKNLRVVLSRRQRVFDGMLHETARRAVRRITRDDNVGAIRQWFADRFVVSAPHDDMMAGGDPAEMPEVSRQPPRERVVDAD